MGIFGELWMQGREPKDAVLLGLCDAEDNLGTSGAAIQRIFRVNQRCLRVLIDCTSR